MVVNLGDAGQSTPTISKTLNPEWNVTFDLPLSPQSLLLEAVCWDKDRLGKDYLGEFHIPLEDIFANGDIVQQVRTRDISLQPSFEQAETLCQPHWYRLESRKIKKASKKKGTNISGEVQLQFSLLDTTNPSAAPDMTLRKLATMLALDDDDEDEEDDVLSRIDSRGFDVDDEDDDDDDDKKGMESSEETDDVSKPEKTEKRMRRLRLKRLRRRTMSRAYEFTGGTDVVGIVFVEISRIVDLPPERNSMSNDLPFILSMVILTSFSVTRTSFDMDPFVVASLGRKTYRTRVIRHNLNPVFEEKMVFQVMRHEQNYSMSFSVVDRDKLSGNDFVGTANFPLHGLTSVAPEADPKTGLYSLPEPPDSSVALSSSKSSRFRLAASRSSSASSLNKMAASVKPNLAPRTSQQSLSTQSAQADGANALPNTSPDAPRSTPPTSQESTEDTQAISDDPTLKTFMLPLILKNRDRWEDKHNPQLTIKARYLPYPALRQQFWRAMLKQYDSDENARVSKVELTTMLDTLGSTLKESTINSFFERYAEGMEIQDPMLTYDQAVICLEDQLQQPTPPKSWGDTMRGYGQDMKGYMDHARLTTVGNGEREEGMNGNGPVKEGRKPAINTDPDDSAIPAIAQDYHGANGEAGDLLAEEDDLTDERGEEHVVEIRECPLCHQPRLNKKSDADIITHIATCASQDWRQVNNIVMAGFVTSSQAQRKWYSKVITKISYGGYKLGANSANILVQDRVTGQINEERMSVYVRLGIRLLYKGLKSREMEKKRSKSKTQTTESDVADIPNAVRKMLRNMSFKQGRKYDDPASAREIRGFINFHQLDMTEVRKPIEEFKNFNEFFYRELKVDARPCSAPENPKIIVSPADCRSVVFNNLTDATKIWVKGREFTIEHLLGNAYPQDAERYKNGALGIFRLAPQDYHRFHIPVDGVMDKPKLIEGEYYTVNPMAIRSTLDVYGENVRVCVPIDSVAHGRVMVICVGAMMVGSTVITRQAGEQVHRAEELGYFKFGGSTILLLFEPNAMQFDADIIDNSNGALETLVSPSSRMSR